MNEEFALLLTELGHEWLKYYEDTTYEFMKVKVVLTDSSAELSNTLKRKSPAWTFHLMLRGLTGRLFTACRHCAQFSIGK